MTMPNGHGSLSKKIKVTLFYHIKYVNVIPAKAGIQYLCDAIAKAQNAIFLDSILLKIIQNVLP